MAITKCAFNADGSKLCNDSTGQQQESREQRTILPDGSREVTYLQDTNVMSREVTQLDEKGKENRATQDRSLSFLERHYAKAIKAAALESSLVEHAAATAHKHLTGALLLHSWCAKPWSERKAFAAEVLALRVSPDGGSTAPPKEIES